MAASNTELKESLLMARLAQSRTDQADLNRFE
jgi:hypothetical protein